MKSLLTYNTFGIDCSCKEIYEPATVEEAQAILAKVKSEPYMILGGGSNLLLTQNYDGNVLHSKIKGIERLDSSSVENSDASYIYIRCGSGEVWDDVVAYATEHSYYGMENLSIIPGEVGASAVQNIGAYGVEAKDLIYSIEAIEIETGNVLTINPADCHYAYRYSKFKDEWKNNYFITYVTYRLSKDFKPCLGYGNLKGVLASKLNVAEDGLEGIVTATMVREAIIEIRNAKLPDPKVEGNAGSFFMNPIVDRAKFESLQKEYPNMPHYDVDDNRVKIPAGWMIDQCGWKGKSMGRAGVHKNQALVLVNKGGATGKEIVDLCNAIRIDVFNRFGIMINPEVNII